MDNILLFALGQLVTGAAVWGAIRADIRNIHQRLDRVQADTKEAHQRLDRHIEWQLDKMTNGK